MNGCIKLVSLFAALTILSTPLFANQPRIRLGGEQEAYVPFANNGGQIIKLHSVTLSHDARQNLITRIKNLHSHAAPASSLLASAINLLMNNVPVLNQGKHDTDVTFAATAAVEAAYGMSDYISQLCSLELGTYLESQDPNYPAGWNGSWSNAVLTQMRYYGAISKVNQAKYGCAGVYEYPLNDANNTGKPMSALEFRKYAEGVMGPMIWKTLIDPDTALSNKADPETVLTKVKSGLLRGHRALCGILVDTNVGYVGNLGKYNNANDSWTLTPEIVNDINNGGSLGSHTMVVMGYNDNIVITNPDRTTTTGALICRNSWGPDAGDHGNYYVSYDYFKAMVLDAEELFPSGPEPELA